MSGAGRTNFIDGRWTADPAGEVKEVQFADRRQRDRRRCAGARGRRPPEPRSRRRAGLNRLGERCLSGNVPRRCAASVPPLQGGASELAALLTLEQGKPMAEADFEVGKAVDGFNLAADLVKYLEGSTIPTEDPTKRVMTFYRPRGVYAVVTPWNFPVNIPVEYIAPGLAAGNTIVWMPAPTTSLVAAALVEAIRGRGPAAGRPQPRHRRGRGRRRRDRLQSRHRRGGLHRQRGDRQADQPARRRQAAADGARRQRPGGDPATTPISTGRRARRPPAASSMPGRSARRRSASWCTQGP